jgi:hypothetical protein
MPTVKIGTPGVTVELNANDEASIGELSKQAMDLFREATAVHHAAPTGAAVGFTAERRGTADHHDPVAPYGRRGFRPVTA